MGNICCGGYEEEYKHGAWRGGHDDDDDDEYCNKAEEDEDQYNANATNREQLILLHEKTKRSSQTATCTRTKRQSIRSTPMDNINISSSFTFESTPKSTETTDFLLSALSDNFVFDSIDISTKLQFFNVMQYQEYNEGDWVMKQGDVGDYFYILEEGEVAYHVVTVEDEQQQVGTGTKGSTFGELALLYNTPRAASVQALSHLKVYKIDQLTFRSLLTSNELKDRNNIISLVSKVDVFNELDDSKIHKLVDAFTTVQFANGERIVNKGDVGNVLYIVKSGSVKLEDIGHGNSKFDDQIFNVGMSFGERALTTGDTRSANVTALTDDTSLLAISKNVLEEILGSLGEACHNSSLAKYLRSIPLFDEYMEQEEIERCVMHLKKEKFYSYEPLDSRGKLFLIQDGGPALMTIQDKCEQNKSNGSSSTPEKKKMTNGATLVRLEKGDYFGNLFPDDGDTNDASPNFINVEADMECLTLAASDIEKIIGGRKRITALNLDSIAADRAVNHKPRSRTSRLNLLKSMMSKKSSIDDVKQKKTYSNRDVMNSSKLDKHRILGIGAFGKVWLVTPKSNTKTPYALKMISKHQVLEQRLASAVMREKNVMESIDSQFLLQMLSSFQDEHYLYFVLGLVLGGELFELLYSYNKTNSVNTTAFTQSAFYQSYGVKEQKQIKGCKGVGVPRTVFYSACVIEAFNYLHNRRIVYRDLKPENVMLNENGYCVVVDMGFAKVVMDKTYTMCGTPEYIAPEVICNKGHNNAADYWSFGCLLYEFVVGQTPFFAPNIDQLSMLKKIVKADYVFPDSIAHVTNNSDNGLISALWYWKDLISRLLKPRSTERLGNLQHGIEDILNHELFASIDRNDFLNQKLPAPWIPNIKDPLDTSNMVNKFAGLEKKKEIFLRKISAKDQEVFSSF